ncbi:hypothetical protein [Acidihalobacter yilgarnensis]|nr:hypothetical protein [Acidihalobacter yilgarnensis]
MIWQIATDQEAGALSAAGEWVPDSGIDAAGGAGADVAAGGIVVVGVDSVESESAGALDSFFPQPANRATPSTTTIAATFR